MKSTLLKLPPSDDVPNLDQVQFCIGRIVDITDDYRAKIDYPGNPLGPVIARSVVRESDCEGLLDATVMLIFENSDPTLPIIIGLVHENINTPNMHETFDVPSAKQHEVGIDGKRLVFEADKEIVLRCGRSSMTLRADGKVIVKGKNLVSRASVANKIRGASVNIN